MARERDVGVLGAEHELALVQHGAQLRLRARELARLSQRERVVVARHERAPMVRAESGAVDGERVAVELERA